MNRHPASQIDIAALSTSGVSTSAGSTSRVARPATSVPTMRYTPLARVGPSSGWLTMYTVPIAQYGRDRLPAMAMYSAATAAR